MTNLIVVAVLAVILGAVIRYLYKEKKRGNVCVGCPYGRSCCGHSQGGCSGCGGAHNDR